MLSFHPRKHPCLIRAAAIRRVLLESTHLIQEESPMAAGAGAAAATAAIANAVKASGAIVQVEPESFLKILARSIDPLVVTAEGGFFKTKYQYLASYKGLDFYCESDEVLTVPAGTELIPAGKIWIPGM
jgi:hypothetical protein